MLKRNDFKQFRIRFSFCLSMIFPENRRPRFGIMLYTATDLLFVGACERTAAVTIMIACYGHIVTSSTAIPVDGRTNRPLFLPLTYFNPCSPSMAARLSDTKPGCVSADGSAARGRDEYRTGCRQRGHRGDEDAAFHDEAPCLVPKKIAGSTNNGQRPAQFPARGN
jgi:hypothetical protein